MFAGLILISSVKGVTITSVHLETNEQRAQIQTLLCFGNIPPFVAKSADIVNDDYSCAK